MTTDLAAHHAAGQPVKATVTLTMQIGLVSIPLALYAGVEDGDTAVKRSQFTTDDHPVGNMPYDKKTEKPYAGDVVKKVQLDTDQWVELTDDEIAIVLGNDSKGIAEVESFVPLASLGREYVIVGTNQARPAKISVGSKKKDSPAAAKALALFLAAMAEEQVGALMKVTFRTKSRYGVLTPDGQFHTVAFANQVRARRELPTFEASEKEFAMARQLITGIIGIDTPVLVDTDGEKVLAYVAEKADGGKTIEAVEAVEPAEPESSLEDLLAAAIAVEHAKAEKATATAAA